MEPQNSRKRRKINLSQSCRQYFEKTRTITDENGNKKIYFSCKKCQKELNGTNEGNLVSHMRTHHKQIIEYISYDETIEKKRSKLLLDCVEMISVNGNEFNRLLDSGLLSMIDKTLKELEEAGCSVNLTDPHLLEVKEVLDVTAKKVAHKIREEVNGRPLSLLVDATTKRRRSILGVSVQYILNGKHQIRSIGMLLLNESHTSAYLAKVICELLLQFNIKPQQIIAITTDNGANVVKMVRGLSSKMAVIENSLPQMSREAEICDAEIENYLQNVPDCTDEEALNAVFQSDGEDDLLTANENLLDAVVRDVRVENDTNVIWDIQGIRCAAHTLQLAIRDALQKLEKPIQNVVNICRRIAKTMRLQSTAHELKLAAIDFNVPHIDVETRWCSTYIMVILCIMFCIIE